MSPIGLQPKKKLPELDAVLHWLEAEKKTDLRTLLGEHGFL